MEDTAEPPTASSRLKDQPAGERPARTARRARSGGIKRRRTRSPYWSEPACAAPMPSTSANSWFANSARLERWHGRQWTTCNASGASAGTRPSPSLPRSRSASKIAEELQRESPVLDNPQAIAGLLARAEPHQERRDVPDIDAEHPTTLDPRRAGVAGVARHDPRASARGVPISHCRPRGCHRFGSQPPQRRSPHGLSKVRASRSPNRTARWFQA